MNQRSRAELSLIGVTIIWGTTFVVVKGAIEHTSTLAFIAARFSLAAIVLLVLFGRKLRYNPHLRRVTLHAGMLAGTCLVAGYFLQTLGLRYTTPSKSAFITGLTTVIVPVLSAMIYRRSPRIAEVIGVSVATAGMALLTLTPGRLSLSYGDALTLGCAFAFALHILVLGRYSAVSSFELLSLTQIGVTALLALSVCGWAEPFQFTMSPKVIGAVFITGLFSTALAFTVQAWAQRHTTPTRAGLIFAMEPVSASVTAYLVAGELLSMRGAIGAVLILVGVLVVELKPPGNRYLS
jgi:drug/metabolite transporter (DMT)-like permease